VHNCTYITYIMLGGALVGFSLQPLLVPGRCLCARSTLVVNSLLNRQRELWQSELANTCNLPDAAITDKPRILVQTLLKSLIRKAILDFSTSDGDPRNSQNKFTLNSLQWFFHIASQLIPYHFCKVQPLPPISVGQTALFQCI